MARTSGHGNPKWTRDEVVLALDLYNRTNRRVPSKSDARVIALSELLRQNPVHETAATRSSFRNPDGVSFKLQNLRQVATGVGLGNTSKVDREVWAEFGDKPQEVARLAALIEAVICTAPQDMADTPDEEEFPEGRLITRAHKARERSVLLREKVLKAKRGEGALACECCGYSPPKLDAESWVEIALEVHHIVPLASLGPRLTKVSDVALLCANCHKLTHRMIAREKTWPTPEQLAQRLGVRS